MLTVLSSFSVGAAVFDSTGRLKAADHAYADILKRPLPRLPGVTRDLIDHPDDHGRNLLLMDRLRSDGTSFDITKRYLLPDGSPVWVQNRVSQMFSVDGPPLTMVLSRPLPEGDVRGKPPCDAARLAYAGVVSEAAAAMGLGAQRFTLPETADLLDRVADGAVAEAQRKLR